MVRLDFGTSKAKCEAAGWQLDVDLANCSASPGLIDSGADASRKQPQLSKQTVLELLGLLEQNASEVHSTLDEEKCQ